MVTTMMQAATWQQDYTKKWPNMGSNHGATASGSGVASYPGSDEAPELVDLAGH